MAVERTIPAALLTHLQQDATSLCELIKITPTVGSVLAFTSHTEDLTVDSVLYKSRPGMRLSLVKSKLRMEIDTSEAQGFFVSGVITLSDVLKGKFTDATFERAFVNYEDVSDGKLIFQSGDIGRVDVQDNLFTAELRSLMARLSQSVGRVTAKRCDVVEVGDERCKFDMTSTQSGTGAGFRQNLTVTTVVSSIQFTVDSGYVLGSGAGSDTGDDWFRRGKIQWLTGDNAGYFSEIADVTSFTIGEIDFHILNEPGADITAGDTFYAFAGCDRTTAHCRNKFVNAAQPNGNLVNFRGFPNLIGDELYKPADLASEPSA